MSWEFHSHVSVTQLLLGTVEEIQINNDHRFRLSQTIMESFDRGEYVIAAFLDVDPRCRESLRQCLAQWTQV